MIVEAGHFALALALAISVIQTAVPFWGARTRDSQLMGVGVAAALAQFLFVAIAFAALAAAHLRSDFSVLNVAENSHSAMPAIYKFSGVWGNHEGSMLLWSLILATFGALVAVFGTGLPERLRADALAVQGLIGAAFLIFILATSDPFTRLDPAPIEGRDLNPILQDPGLAIHPPLLYMGYVGFSIVFSFAAAALIEGRIDAAWARFVRPFALIAWGFLTLGIAMGSYWAYYTLGWGGFWFWDPVENASLMPWLAGTAFLHSVGVMEKRDALKIWTIFLAILAFSFSLIGTFLVRSGVLTSVHAFASDPRRGEFILAILAFFIAGSLALFAWRAGQLKPGGLFAPISREGALVINNLLLATACASVLFGTHLPAGARATDGRKDHGRRAVLQHDGRHPIADADFYDPDRLLAGLEARRSLRGRSAARRRRRGRPCHARHSADPVLRRPGAGADRGGACRLCDARLDHRSCHAPQARRRVAAGYGFPRARPAAVVLGRRARPFRRRRHDARPRRDRLWRRVDRLAAASVSRSKSDPTRSSSIRSACAPARTTRRPSPL